MNQKVAGIAVLIIIFATLFCIQIAPSSGNTSTVMTLPSAGIITTPVSEFSLLVGMGHPAWSYDRASNPVNIRALVNLVANSGANCWREAMYVDSSVSGYYINLKAYCDQAGLKFIIQTVSASVGAMTYQEETNIIQNVNGAQVNWINAWGNIIRQLHPYAIMVMNEPTNNGAFSKASSTQFNYYRQFCNNSINAWRSIQPDIIVIVQNDPFNDLFDSTSYGFAANPLPFSDVIYSRHIYYSYDGTYPPSYLPEQQTYWNAKTATDFSQAKQRLTAFITAETCQTLVNKGQKVMFDEWGSNVNSPNAQNFTRDFMNICEQKSIGQIYYDIVPSSYESTGLLNEDYLTFNSMGQVWNSCIG
jgi:hypothetical protein